MVSQQAKAYIQTYIPKKRWCWIIAMVFGITATLFGMLNEFDKDPFSGASCRGFPVASLKLLPKWHQGRNWRIEWGGFCGNTVFWNLISIPIPFVWRRRKINLVRRRLQEARCLKCDYDLRYLQHRRCPECGEPYDPRLFYVIPEEINRDLS